MNCSPAGRRLPANPRWSFCVGPPRNHLLSLRSLDPGLPRDLESICLKCLAKEPSRPLSLRRGAGRGPGQLAGRPADSGSPGRIRGAALALGEAQPAGVRPRRGASPSLGRRDGGFHRLGRPHRRFASRRLRRPGGGFPPRRVCRASQQCARRPGKGRSHRPHRADAKRGHRGARAGGPPSPALRCLSDRRPPCPPSIPPRGALPSPTGPARKLSSTPRLESRKPCCQRPRMARCRFTSRLLPGTAGSWRSGTRLATACACGTSRRAKSSWTSKAGPTRGIAASWAFDAAFQPRGPRARRGVSPRAASRSMISYKTERETGRLDTRLPPCVRRLVARRALPGCDPSAAFDRGGGGV